MPQNQKQFHHMAGDGLEPGPGFRDVADMTNGDDFARGGNAPDVFYAYNGNDLIYAGRGPDKIFGMRGDDSLHGGKAPDSLHGGGGNDRLRGGADADKLRGGAGEDAFIYRDLADTTSAGFDFIRGFDTGVDHILLKGEFDVAQSDIHIVDNGKITVITIDGLDFELHVRGDVSIDDFGL
jgi:Ca2+-binding RTX toxin-like protein